MAGSPQGALVAGVDLATAEVRVAVADGHGRVVARARAATAPPQRPAPGVSEQDPASWWPAVARCLREAVAGLGTKVVAVTVSATSGTVVIADTRGDPIGPAVLYDDQRCPAPRRWDRLLEEVGASAGPAHAWHASDLVVARLTGTSPPTDWSHALKTGYDPATGAWATAGPAAALRPQVSPPTSAVGAVCAAAAADTGLDQACDVRLGMTDACTAQVAAGADRPGRFVTVLGTTMAVKGASTDRIDDAATGAYSHRHPDGWWLPGGASNVGGGSLAARFGGGDLAALDAEAAAQGPAAAVCYPLASKGERFPFACGDAEELWAGRPAGRAEEYRAVLEGVAFVERLAYERLAVLGAGVAAPVRTAGGGSASGVWSSIRATVLGLPVVRPASADTAFGACILAATGTLHESLTAAADAMVGDPVAETGPVAAERDRLDDSYGRFIAALRERGWLPWPA